VGSYIPISSGSIFKKYDSKNLISLTNKPETDNSGWSDKSGWYYYNNPNGGYTNFSGTIFGNVNGYLFLFFKYIDTNGYRRYICAECYGDDKNGACRTLNSHQGPIFAVIIQNISQINALNRTMASQSDGVFLSTTIKNALDANNQTIKSVINQIRISTGETETTTPIISPILNPITTVFSNDYFDIDLSDVSEISGGNNFSAYKDFDISKFIIKRENFVNNMGSIEFTEFMLTSYIRGYNATFVLPNGAESTIIGSLDQLDKSNSIGGSLGFIRVRRDIFGFGSLFGQTTGSFMLGFTQPYFEIQNQPYTSKRLSINFRVKFK
jgi:hypothetical protein